MKRIIQLGALLVLLSLFGAADQSLVVDLGNGAEGPAGSSSNVHREGNAWVQQMSGELRGARMIKVFTDAGSVRVTGSDRDTVAYQLRKKVYTSSEEAARRDFERFKISASTLGDAAVFRGECHGPYGHTSIDFDLQVPRGMTVVFVRTEGGSVNVNNITGRVDLQTEGGSIGMDNIGGTIAAETSGGSIDVGNAGAEVKVETSGGSITIRNANGRTSAETSGGSIEVGTIKAPAVLNTAGGSIRVQMIGGDLSAETAGGNLDIGDVAGRAKLSTAGGSIRLNSAQGRVDADTAGGSIRLQQVHGGATAQTAAGSIYVEFVGGKAGFSDSRFETTAGDIVVVLPSNLGTCVRAGIEMATGHKIRTDFAEVKVTSEDNGGYGPREVYAEGCINGGGPALKAQTTIGNIDFRKGSR